MLNLPTATERVPKQKNPQPPIFWVTKRPLAAPLAHEAESEWRDRMLTLFVPSWSTHGTAVISRIAR